MPSMPPEDASSRDPKTRKSDVLIGRQPSDPQTSQPMTGVPPPVRRRRFRRRWHSSQDDACAKPDPFLTFACTCQPASQLFLDYHLDAQKCSDKTKKHSHNIFPSKRNMFLNSAPNVVRTGSRKKENFSQVRFSVKTLGCRVS